jgi:hypothetical protein
MMEQMGHRLDAEHAEAFHALVLPAPIAATIALDSLPVGWITQGTEAKRGDAVEIIDSILVPTHQYLIVERVADSIDGAFDPAPELEVVR